MTAAIKVGDLVRPKLIVAGKHLWVVIGEEIRPFRSGGELRYLTIAHGSNKMHLYEKDVEKVSE
jgi:hypothetical protein